MVSIVWCDICGLELVREGRATGPCGCPRCGAKHVEIQEVPEVVDTGDLVWDRIGVYWWLRLESMGQPRLSVGVTGIR